jgi:hypothetical protein
VSELLLFVPVIALLFLANLGLFSRLAAVLTILFLGAWHLLMLVTGLGLLVAAGNPSALAAMPVGELAGRLGPVLAATGLVGLVLLWPRAAALPLKALGLWESGVLGLTVLLFALDLVGTGLAQALLMPVLARVSPEALPSATLLVGQGLAFAVMGFVGVGWPLRRSLPGAMRRLGLGGLRLRWLLLALGLAALATGASTLVERLWAWVDPVRFRAFEEQTERLFGTFMSPGLAAALALSAGVGEEILFRGALQPRFGLLPTSALFGFIHSYYGLNPGWSWIFIIAFLLGLLRERTNTTVCIIFHATYNLLVLLVGFT